MVRLKDIAQHANVSVMTVSKALRDAPDVSAATKARIKAFAQQVGYVPDSSAQGLRTRTTKLLGLVIPASTNPIYARVVFAIEERAHELGYDILLAHTLNLPERENAVIRRLLSRRVDGLFITPVYRLSLIHISTTRRTTGKNSVRCWRIRRTKTTRYNNFMRRPELDQILTTMLASQPEVSDLNFTSGRPPQVEAYGELKPVALEMPIEKLTPFQTEMIALNIVGDNLWQIEDRCV